MESPYGPHLWLDIRHLGREHMCTNLREVSTICGNFVGIDCAESLIPVVPTQHYTMGGVRTNIDGDAKGLQGLFAAGESACWDLHGFNRLGGNSLAETLVMGMVVGDRVADYAKESRRRLLTDSGERLRQGAGTAGKKSDGFQGHGKRL